MLIISGFACIIGSFLFLARLPLIRKLVWNIYVQMGIIKEMPEFSAWKKENGFKRMLKDNVAGFKSRCMLDNYFSGAKDFLDQQDRGKMRRRA
jgi:hypothetical protein